MLKKITICSICGSQSCDGIEWEAVPGDKGLSDYWRMPGSFKTPEICSSMISKDPEPVYRLVAGHGIYFDIRVKKKG